MTFRELINEVLIRLREDTIATDWSGNINDSTTVTDYQKVIGSLINDSKRNIESYHDWLVLRETVDVATVSGTRNYNLSSGQEIKIIDVINQATGINLVQVSRQYINSTLYPSANSGEPLYYAFNGADSSNNLKVDLEPKPNSVQTISFDIVKYQDELKTASTTIKIPEKPVVLGAWARAIAERGEDGGSQTSVVAQETSESLN
ncbi:MAG: hypothetical protein HOF36_00650, partial [Candidatus Marinimicrobia bacterium]|nr:hypothetical protein [Candidatus Neomarinimicrobiota bacterium]